MTAQETIEKRIKAAKASGELIHSLAQLSNAQHRHAFMHDKIKDALLEICAENKAKHGQVFSDDQVDCLISICFHIAFIMDPRNNAPAGMLQRIKSGWSELKIAEKAGVLVAVPACIVGLLQIGEYGVSAGNRGYEFLFKQPQAEETIPARPAPEDKAGKMTSPDATANSMKLELKQKTQ